MTFARGSIIAAVAVYGIVLGLAVWPGEAPARQAQARLTQARQATAPESPSAPSPGQQAAGPARLPLRGVAMEIQRVDWIDRYEQSIDEISALGADTVLFVVDARQENGSSSRIYLDMRMTPTPDQLGRLIRHAKDRRLRVILMPLVLLDAPRGNEWRGTLKPESRADWFRSYRDVMGHFAWVAEANGADVLVVGSELVSSESHLEEWTLTITHLREVFSGLLTYSANWDHYTPIPFWDQLDLVGMNSYYRLGRDHTVTIEQIESRWQEIQQDLLAFQQQVGKPILFTEVGWCSLQNAAHEPWDYTKDVPIDLDLQRRLYEGFFRTWHGHPALGGYMIWKWTPDAGGPDDRGYTPQAKPAEQVLRHWLAEDPWNVSP
jgi:hypothetical protein